MACQNGHLDVLKYLNEECQVDVNLAQNVCFLCVRCVKMLFLCVKDGTTLLMRACLTGHYDCHVDVNITDHVCGFHCMGSSLKYKTQGGVSALFYCAQNGFLNIVRCLCSHSTLPELQQSALRKSQQKGHVLVSSHIVPQSP